MTEVRHLLRSALLVLCAAGALALLTAAGLSVGHPFAGALAGYVAFLALAARAFATAVPDADEAMRGEELPPGLLHLRR